MVVGGFFFIDVIWYLVGDFGLDKEIFFMMIVSIVVNYCGLEIILYMICCC